MTDTSIHRSLPDRLDNPLKSAVLSWESLLVLVALAIFVANSLASPYFLNAWSLSDLTFNFTEKALIALAMALLIISGEIDLSVAAIAGVGAMLVARLVAEDGNEIVWPLALLAGAVAALVIGAAVGIVVPRRRGKGASRREDRPSGAQGPPHRPRGR